MDQKIKELADSFFEWPTEDRSAVTLASALFFAEHVARTVRAEEEARRQALKSALESIRSWFPGSTLECARYAEKVHRIAHQTLQETKKA